MKPTKAAGVGPVRGASNNLLVPQGVAVGDAEGTRRPRLVRTLNGHIDVTDAKSWTRDGRYPVTLYKLPGLRPEQAFWLAEKLTRDSTSPELAMPISADAANAWLKLYAEGNDE